MEQELGIIQSFDWMSDLLAPGIGVFLGVVAGACVQYMLQWLNGKFQEKQELRNFKFELQFNINKVDGLLKEMVTLRNSVNANALEGYFGYLKTTGCLIAVADEMLRKGLLYKHLSHDDIWKLQEHYQRLSGNEAWYNSEITKMKEQYNPKERVDMVNFIEGQFQDAKVDLEGIRDRLSI